jgi:hypothetical protein
MARVVRMGFSCVRHHASIIIHQALAQTETPDLKIEIWGYQTLENVESRHLTA